MSRSVEQELKLLAPDELLLPRFDDLGLTPGPPESRVLVATYLDTPDLRLARSGASLRWRDDEACWVVKLPSRSASDVLTRDTYGFDGPLSTPAPAAVKLVTAIVRRVPLDVVARLTTRRTRIPLCDPHGKAVLEIDDDRVEAETMNGPVTFREIEAELLADDSSDRVLDDIRGRLQAVGAQKSDGLPKIVRALGERARRPPDVDPAARVPRAPTVEQVLGYALASSVAQLILHDPGTRTGEDPEDVHKARVATRRLRSHLRTFRSHLDQRWASALQDDLRWLGRAFGQVRDVEVLRERLVADAVNLEPQDHAAFGTVLALLDDQWRTARAHLLGVLDDARYVDLLERLVDAADHPRLSSDRPRDIVSSDDAIDELRSIVRRPWKKLRKALDRVSSDAPDEELHRARIRAKHARYAAEAVEAVFGKPARRYVRAVTAVQEILGEHQDAVVASAWLRTQAATLPSDGAFVAGELVAHEHAAARRARADLPDAWRRANRAQLRRWIN